MREEIIRELSKLVARRTRAEVTIKEVIKNNNSKLTGLIIREVPKRIAPIIYIDTLLKELEKAEITIQDAVEWIVRMYENNKEMKYFSNVFTQDKEHILERVEYRLVNKALNKKLLIEVPHKDFLDLAVMYNVIVNKDESKSATFLVNNEMIEALEINHEELEEAARRNTEKSGFKKTNMIDIMENINGVKVKNKEADYAMPMYVLTNDMGHNGANVMLYSNLFNELSDEYGSDLYVLPSSVHEVIVIPVLPDADPVILKMIVAEINRTEVSKEEILSETVYKWNKEMGKMDIVI